MWENERGREIWQRVSITWIVFSIRGFFCCLHLLFLSSSSLSLSSSTFLISVDCFFGCWSIKNERNRIIIIIITIIQNQHFLIVGKTFSTVFILFSFFFLSLSSSFSLSLSLCERKEERERSFFILITQIMVCISSKPEILIQRIHKLLFRLFFLSFLSSLSFFSFFSLFSFLSFFLLERSRWVRIKEFNSKVWSDAKKYSVG